MPSKYSFKIAVVVQALIHIQLFAAPWTAACEASLSFTISWHLLKLMSIESVMLSNYLILCHPLLLLPSIFPSHRPFPVSWLFASGGQSIKASVSASILHLWWSENCLVMSDSLQLHGLYSPWNFLGLNTGVGSLSLLQGIFPTQESNPGLLHCRRFFTSWATREALIHGRK